MPTVRLGLGVPRDVYGRRQCLSYCPSQFQSVGNGDAPKAGVVRPFRKGASLTAETNNSGTAPIPSLLPGCSPAAILWAVAKRVLNSVQRRSGWPFAHVGKEVGEVIPALADGDAPEVIRFSGVITSRLHGIPRTVGTAASHTALVLAPPALLETFHFQATTRLRMPALHGRGRVYAHGAASTTHPPAPVPFDYTEIRNERKPIKFSHAEMIPQEETQCLS